MLLLVSATLAVAAPKPGAEGTPEFEKASGLVKQLGHPRFAVREMAARQILEMGGAAVTAVTAGTKSDDEEVRTRCLALLPQTRALEWKRRVDAYLADTDGKQIHELPLLAEWEKLTGKPDPGSRKVYADMVRTSGDFLERFAERKSPAVIAEQCRAVLARIKSSSGQIKAPAGELAALVFADTFNPELRQRRTIHVPIGDILNNPTWRDALDASEIGPPLRKLVVQWWVDSGGPGDSNSWRQFANLVRTKPFPEAVPALAKIATDKKADSISMRLIAVEALGKVGGKEATSVLMGLLTDTTKVFGGGEEEHLISASALAALLTINGKRLADFGLTENFGIRFPSVDGEEGFSFTLHGFRNADARKKAMQKWKDESEKKDKK